jgi:hypothetical protein
VRLFANIEHGGVIRVFGSILVDESHGLVSRRALFVFGISRIGITRYSRLTLNWYFNRSSGWKWTYSCHPDLCSKLERKPGKEWNVVGGVEGGCSMPYLELAWGTCAYFFIVVDERMRKLLQQE